ncbi:MAG: hypothetical protein U0R72_20130 [Nakamurella multipartita]
MTVDPRAPERAPTRTDLTWLRHRSRVTAGAGSGSRSGSAGPGRSGSALADFVAGRSTARRPAAGSRPAPAPAAPAPVTPAPARPAPAPAAAASSSLDLSSPLDLSAPAAPPSSGSLDLFGPSAPAASPPPPAPPGTGSSSLDLSEPLTPPAVPARAPSGSTSLDLGGPAAPPPARPTGSTSLDLGPTPLRTPSSAPSSSPSNTGPAPGSATSLDLSGAPVPPAAPATPAAPSMRRPASTWQEPRTTPGVPTTLNPRRPTVTLTRVQSGVGTLTFEAIITAAAGDLRLGCAYQLRSGLASTVAHHTGRRYAPPGQTRRPLIVASRQDYERIAVDLRQVTDLERLVVYAFSGNGQPLQWGGTLIATTFGGDRIEMPIELAPAPAVAVLASVYNIGGELIIRSEMDLIGSTVREACRGYGFDRISWVDDTTPID